MCGDAGDDAGSDEGGAAHCHTARRARDSSKSCEHETSIRTRIMENAHARTSRQRNINHIEPVSFCLPCLQPIASSCRPSQCCAGYQIVRAACYSCCWSQPEPAHLRLFSAGGCSCLHPRPQRSCWETHGQEIHERPLHGLCCLSTAKITISHVGARVVHVGDLVELQGRGCIACRA